MNYKIYEELRCKGQEIRELNQKLTNEEKVKAEETVAQAVIEMCRLANVARKGGLLALEEEIENLVKTDWESYAADIVILVVDGTEPEIIEQISLNRYYANDLQAYEGLIYIIYLQAMLAMQQGMNPFALEKLLLAMVSKDIEKKYMGLKVQVQQEEVAQKEQEELINMEYVYQLCEEEEELSPFIPEYYTIKMCDYILDSMDDRALQRLLRDIDNSTLIPAMKVLSTRSKRHIFNNMSKRLAIMIADEMRNRPSASIRSATKAIHDILHIYFKLIYTAEIVTSGTIDISGFHDLFIKAEKHAQAKEQLQDEFYVLLNEYREKYNDVW